MLITPINKSKETDGVEIAYYGVNFIIARANNTNFKHSFRVLTAPYKFQIENNQTIPDDVSETIMFKCYAQSILVGWSNCFDKDGNEIPYSKENAYELLSDDDDAYDFVKTQSENMNNFLEKEVAETKVK